MNSDTCVNHAYILTKFSNASQADYKLRALCGHLLHVENSSQTHAVAITCRISPQNNLQYVTSRQPTPDNNNNSSATILSKSSK